MTSTTVMSSFPTTAPSVPHSYNASLPAKIIGFSSIGLVVAILVFMAIYCSFYRRKGAPLDIEKPTNSKPKNSSSSSSPTPCYHYRLRSESPSSWGASNSTVNIPQSPPRVATVNYSKVVTGVPMIVSSH